MMMGKKNVWFLGASIILFLLILTRKILLYYNYQTAQQIVFLIETIAVLSFLLFAAHYGFKKLKAWGDKINTGENEFILAQFKTFKFQRLKFLFIVFLLVVFIFLNLALYVFFFGVAFVSVVFMNPVMGWFGQGMFILAGMFLLILGLFASRASFKLIMKRVCGLVYLKQSINKINKKEDAQEAIRFLLYLLPPSFLIFNREERKTRRLFCVYVREFLLLDYFSVKFLKKQLGRILNYSTANFQNYLVVINEIDKDIKRYNPQKYKDYSDSIAITHKMGPYSVPNFLSAVNQTRLKNIWVFINIPNFKYIIVFIMFIVLMVLSAITAYNNGQSVLQVLIEILSKILVRGS